MSDCSGVNCNHPSHKEEQPSTVEQLNSIMRQAAESEERRSAIEQQIAQGRSQRNIIIGRIWARDMKRFWFLMLDGSHIKPQTAINRGLISIDALNQALKDERNEQ